MENKSSMSRVERLHREKVTRYSIRKYSFGAASVAVAALFMFLGNGAVSAQEPEIQGSQVANTTGTQSAPDSPSTAPESTPVAKPGVEETTAKPAESTPAAKPAAPEVTTPALDKKQLENYISEVKSKLSAGKYANKTEESLALLNGELASAESTLASATTQDELTKAYQKLVTFVSSGLKNKPKEAPKVDTTNGKETVGKKAENTEPKAGTNSIENTGSHDSRNGKVLDKDNAFRTDATPSTKPANEVTTTAGSVTYTIGFSDVAKKEVYAYNEEETDFGVTVNSTAGKVTYSTIKSASGQYLDGRDINSPTKAEETDGYGWTYHSILNETEGPATVRITGKPNDRFKALRDYTKAENQNAVLGARYLQLVDDAGGKIEKTNGTNAYGYFKMVVKSQTYKYQPKELTNTNKVLVANPNQLTPADLEGIKNALKVEYSKTNTDARLTSLKGTEVADTNTVVDTVTDSGSNLVVTYKDGSTDTIPKGTLIKSGNAPTVNMPRPASGGPLKTSILSTDNTITGTGTPGSKITIQVESAENGKVLKEITDIPVDASGNWTATLENGLNSNVPVGGNARAQNFFAPKNPVKVFETKDGIETASTDTYVSIGASKVLPSEASKDKASVVAGSKEVVLEVPHDAGISYFWYHDKETGKEVQIDIQRDKEVAENLGIKVADKDVDKVAIKSVTKGEFYNTITLEMKKNIKEGVVRIISHNNDGTHSSKAGKVSTPVTNEKPVVASVSGQDTTTVITNSQLNLLSLVKVTDHEDDQPDVTLGDRGHARVISVDGNTSAREVDTSEAGEHTVVYKAVDSQGKESDEYTHKVIVRENKVPEVNIPFSVDGKKDIYVYAYEDTNIDLTFTDDSGKIKSATIKQGGNKSLAAKDAAGDPNVLDNEYDLTVKQINEETATPAKVTISGKVTKETSTRYPKLKADKFPKTEKDEYVLSVRYATATDTDGAFIDNTAEGKTYATDPGAFKLVLKAQTKKYDIKEPTEKTVVNDINKLSESEINTIKDKIKLEYSKTNDDKNLLDKRGQEAESTAAIASVTQEGENLVVTYQDGSKDTIPVDKVVKLDKQPAIDEVTKKANDQLAAINGNDNLTQAEKDKAIADVNKGKDAALEKIADATNATDVNAGKDEGTDAVAKVNPVAKEKAKQAIADELKAKNDELDNRKDLSDKEKADAKAEAKKLADAELAKVNAQPDNKETAAEAAEAQKAVDAAKDKGVADVKTVNPIAKENALKAVADELAKKEKQIDARPDLTKEEKDAAKEEAKGLAKKATDAISAQPDKEADPAAAKTAQDVVDAAKKTGVDEVAAVNPPANKKTEANTAVADEAEAKKQAIQNDNTLSEAAKEKLKKEVDAIKEASNAAIEGAKKNADVDKAQKAAEQAIKAINSARVPGNKLVAKNPTNLDADEQAKLKKAIEAVNPGATVEVKPDGSAVVTYPEKAPETLKQADLTKSADALDTPNGGNDIKRPADKVIVKDPAKLTDAEKEKIKKAVRDVNPNAVVTMDDNGTVTVSTPEGKTAAFPASELVRTLEDAAKPDSGNAGVRKPADKVVGDATNPADQAKVTEKLQKLNGPDAKVQYDDEGNATVVLPNGTIATIPASDLFKSPEDAKKANGGDDIKKPNSQTVVADKNALTPDEKKAIEDKVKAVNPDAVVSVDEKGNATVTTPEGKTAVIDADDLVKGADEKTTPKAGNNINNPADRVQVADKANLKPEDIAKIKAAVEAVNPDSTVVVDEKGNATVTTPEGKTATIPVSELVKTPADKENVTGGNQVNTPADRVVVENPAALTEPEKEAIKAKIQAVNPGADVVFDEKGNATVTTPEGKTATIPASDLVKPKADLADPTKQDAVNKPADKVVVDPAVVAADKDLPTEAKDAIKAAVEAVNPGSTVVVDDKGNATVTTPGGKTVVIPKADLVKKEADKETAKAGNNINKPADKVVADKDALTPENIEAIKAKVEAVNPGATVVVDDKGNATVVTPEGKTATIPVTDLVKSPAEAEGAKAGNDVNKPADKVAANKDALTPEDIKAIEAKVKAVNPDAKVFVDDKGNATVSTPDGKTATIPVEDLVKAPTAKDEVNGGNKVNTPADKVVVKDPAKLTDEEKKAIEAKIKAVNPDAKVAFDEKGNATVTTKDGAVATIPASDLAKTADDLTNPEKQDAVKKPADKTLVKNPAKLTQAEKDAIKAAVAKVNPENTTVVVDEKGNATVTTPDGKTEVIPASDLVKTAKEAEGATAGNNINKPADKVSATPADLTGDKKDEVKAKIQKAVESVNPGATVFVDDKGNATVTTPDGKTATIPVEDLLKDPAAKETPSAGNKVNTPAEKALVDPAVLNDPNATLPKDVKDAIQKAVESVNPGATVVVDDKGNATVTVTNPDGTKTTATIPASDLVKSNAKEDLENAAKQDAVKKPIDETVVADKNALTEPEKEAIKAKVLEVNPGATVVVDEKGNATVTTPEGKTAVIPADDLVKTADEVLTDPKAGNVINKPADRELVTDKDNLTPEDIKAIKDRVAAVNPGASVYVDEKGNATVTTPDGQTATIPVNDLVKTEADKNTANAGNKVNTPADKVLVKDPAKLTAKELEKVEKKIKEVNPGAEVVFDEKGNATVKTKEGNIATIPAADLVKPKADLQDPAKQDAVKKPADKTLVKNPDALTLEEKKAIEAKVKAVNPPADGTTVFVDEKGNATVTTKDGKTVVIPKDDLVKTEAEAANEKAGNNINKPADKVSVKDKDQLTEDDKKAIAAKVKAVNPGAEVFVDDKGNATVTLKDGKSATIPATDLVKTEAEAAKPNAGNKVNTPADKVVVKDPDALTDADKAKVTEAIKAVNPNAEKVVFDKNGNATVTLNDGTTATIPATDLVKTEAEAAEPKAGNNVNTPADKTAVANPEQLTDAEKEAVKKAVEAVNPGATVAVDDKGNATVTTPEGKTAVIPAADLTKSKEEAAKPKAGNDVVKPADKTVVANPEQLTDEEKQAITDKLTALNPDATVVVDDKGNATVTPKDGKPVVIPAADLTKNADAEKAPKAGNDIVKPASKTKVANPDALTPEEKKAIEDKVKAVNPGSTVVVDDKGNATVTLENGKTAVIPASDLTKSEKDVNDGKAKDNAVTPAAKTKVANPEKLTEAEKKAIADKVKAANPGATVVVDDKGNATVVKDGNVSVIPSTDLVKVEDDAKKENGGNDANTPAAKTVVANPEQLTDEEKAAVKKAVEAVNPGSTVVVDDKGNATVTKGDGTVLNIPASDLVIPAEKFADEAKNAKVKTPAIRTLVENKAKLTDAEQAAVKKSIEAVNPGATVVVDDQGNATVTMPDGSTATIAKEQLVKDKEAVSKSKHGGDNLDIDLSKVEVADLANITPEEKAKFQFKVLGAITNVEEFDLDAYIKSTDEDGNTVYASQDGKVKITIDKDGNATVEKDGKKELAINIDKAGNVTIVTKEGQVLAIPRDDAFKQRPYVPSNGGSNNSGNGNGTSGNNAANNTDAKVNKAKLEGAIHQLDELIIKESAKLDAETAKEANDLLADAKKVFANADATQAEVDAMVKRIEDFMAKVASSTDHATPANDQASQTLANASQTASAQANARKAAKELPNTGTADSTVAMVAAAASALLGLGLAGRRRKEDEEA